jgi:glycosyltransferase involved in cell wall biosynthesis
VTLVTVCIPTRNQAPYLADAVRSALTQDVDELEVVVHDDASTDETPAVLEGVRDPRLRVLRHVQPRGIAANRNSCLADARGRYVAWLDSDDVLLPGSLKRRLDLLESQPSVGLVHGAVELIDETNRLLPPWPALFENDTVQPGAVAFRDLLESNTITTSTVVVRNSVQADVGGFSTHTGRTSSDWEMWMRLALRADVAYIAAPLARYRQHGGSITSNAQRTGERLRCDAKVTQQILRTERRRIMSPREAERTARISLAAKALTQAGDLYTAGQRREAARLIVLAARLAPRTAGVDAARLLFATMRGDDYGSYRATRHVLGALAAQLGPSRLGLRLGAAASSEKSYEELVARVAHRVRRLTPRSAEVATATKWDPTVLWLSRRRGVQFPDRRQMPDGYPREDDGVIAHLELLRGRGLTHLVFIASTMWWLEHYPRFAAHLDATAIRIHEDPDCVVYDLRR